MEFDGFLKQALPLLGYAWRPHRRRAVRRKILQRTRELHLSSLEDYLYFLQESSEEKEIFRQLLPVTVSRFFRNHEYYDFLRLKIFPNLLRRTTQHIHVWSVGAAAGEEPYSIAMVWDHWFASQYQNHHVRIRASDIDPVIIKRGKAGIYEKSSIRELPQELTQRYFQVTNKSYHLDPSIRDRIEWIQSDIRKDSPLLENEIIFCCYSAFTYFSKQLQSQLVVKLAHSLVTDGYLILGKKEDLPKIGLHYFRPVSPPLKVYKRL